MTARARADLERGIVALRAQGAEAIVLGCTELSMIYHDLDIQDPDIVDSLDALARATIRASGKTLRDEH